MQQSVGITEGAERRYLRVSEQKITFKKLFYQNFWKTIFIKNRKNTVNSVFFRLQYSAISVILAIGVIRNHSVDVYKRCRIDAVLRRKGNKREGGSST